MIAFIYLITFFILRASTRLVKILGETGNNVMMRLMGLILMVIAVECFVSGVKPILVDILKEGAYHHWHTSSKHFIYKNTLGEFPSFFRLLLINSLDFVLCSDWH